MIVALLIVVAWAGWVCAYMCWADARFQRKWEGIWRAQAYRNAEGWDNARAINRALMGDLMRPHGKEVPRA